MIDALGLPDQPRGAQLARTALQAVEQAARMLQARGYGAPIIFTTRHPIS